METLTGLKANYYEYKVRRKKKGAGKGYKIKTELVWKRDASRREYLNEFGRNDPKGCGLFLCGLERYEMQQDRWWDCDECRNWMVKEYRSRIAKIRKEYGLSYDEVKEFYAL